MTDLDIAKIKEAAERMDLSWHQCDVTVGGSPLIIMQASAYIQMCAPHTILALIARLEVAEARASTAYADGVEAAAKVAENYRTVDHIAWDGHIGIFPKSSTVPDYLAHAIRALLKDKPNG